MKTRILWTKIYEDTWFCSLKLDERFMFIYLFSNSRIGHTGIYELPERVVYFETNIEPVFYKLVKEKFEKDNKAYFFGDWVYMPRAAFYGGYKGDKNKLAYEKEKKSIPLKVIEAFKSKRDGI